MANTKLRQLLVVAVSLMLVSAVSVGQYVPAPGAVSSNLLFTPDATYDIGASGATRPRNIYASGTGTFGGALSGLTIAGTGLTTNVLPKAGAAGVLGDSAIADTGSDITVTSRTITSTNGAVTANGFLDINTTFSFSTSRVNLANSAMGVWSSTAAMTGGKDLGIARNAAGVLEVNSGVAGTLRDIKARSFYSGGTVPGISGCSAGTQLGGGTIGSFVSGTTGVCTVTLTFALTATTGWICDAQDLTTFASFANIFHPTSFTTTTCVIAATTISGDVVQFTAFPY